MRAVALSLLLGVCSCRERAAGGPRALADAGPEAPARATHVCYGAGGAAVELPTGTPCASVGAYDQAPALPPPPPLDVPRATEPLP